MEKRKTEKRLAAVKEMTQKEPLDISSLQPAQIRGLDGKRSPQCLFPGYRYAIGEKADQKPSPRREDKFITKTSSPRGVHATLNPPGEQPPARAGGHDQSIVEG